MELDVGDDKKEHEGGNVINSDFQSERWVDKYLSKTEMVLFKNGSVD